MLLLLVLLSLYIQSCEDGTARCHEFVCILGELLPNTGFALSFTARLWNSTFVEVSFAMFILYCLYHDGHNVYYDDHSNKNMKN